MLTECGFLAAARADVRRAEVIFGALERVRPAQPFAYVGLGVTYMNAGRPDEAAGVLDRGLRCVDDAGQPQLHAFRGLALQMAGRASESVRALEQAPASSLARAMLGRGTMRTEGN